MLLDKLKADVLLISGFFQERHGYIDI